MEPSAESDETREKYRIAQRKRLDSIAEAEAQKMLMKTDSRPHKPTTGKGREINSTS